MIDVRLITTRRSAPAISRLPLKEVRITARIPNRNRATAKDPMVRIKRIFLRNRLARIRPKNLIAHLRLRPFAGDLLQPALLFPGAESHRRARPPQDRASPS